MTEEPQHEAADTPPGTDTITEYDRQHLRLYARLLDADAEGATLSEIVKILFGIDADHEPERAQRLHSEHLERARWMADNGYRDLLAR